MVAQRISSHFLSKFQELPQIQSSLLANLLLRFDLFCILDQEFDHLELDFNVSFSLFDHPDKFSFKFCFHDIRISRQQVKHKFYIKTNYIKKDILDSDDFSQSEVALL